MPAFMRTCLVMLIASASAFACGKEIGDPCSFSSDCSPNGDRICDIASFEGYCTIQGCDLTTCPGEAVCVQFFHGNFSNKMCDPAATADSCDQDGGMCCSLDELCSVTGHCVPRSSEARYCMKKCGSDGDCRDGYECRDRDKMIAHGGQPVLPPGVPVDETSPKFCARATP
jgi:hypothetical protein